MILELASLLAVLLVWVEPSMRSPLYLIFAGGIAAYVITFLER